MNNIDDLNFNDALGERYLEYALSTIMSRSLPDVRDGLKPVHRRLLYAMLQLKLDPSSGFKKCARVVGDVIGKYHPHGDVAVYDTMVRLAQNFAVRYPLVDGQGNFGSIDGDNAAAMRYTEARLTKVATSLLEAIDQDSVDFRPNYDGSEEEPVVMPAAFPNLLANGSEGIAVGMATSIPPHNAEELCDAILHLIKHPNAQTETLLEYVQGPDFPTGGVIIESKENIIKNYDTGRGSFRIRAKWEKEELSHGLYQIVITEIPYQVQKSRLLEKTADLFKAKKLSLLGNIRDESTEDIRVILEPKSRQTDPEMLMESLFKLTELETRFNLNLNVITNKSVPKVLNLRETLNQFIEHRLEVLVRKTNFRLGKIARRLEILEGLLVAYLNIDEVIRIIREEDSPKDIMKARWNLTDNQVEAILNMRLRSLRKLEEIEIRTEHDALSKEQEELNNLLANENLKLSRISQEIKEIKKLFGKNTELGARRTSFADAPISKVISIEAFVEKEPITIILSQMGWIKALKGHIDDLSNVKYKDGDKEKFILKAYTTDKLIIFDSDGRFFTVNCDKIAGGKGFGDPISLIVDVKNPIGIFINKEQKLLVASSIGKGFIVEAKDVIAQTKNGKQVLSLSSGSKAIICKEIEDNHIAIIGDNRKLLIFKTEEIPVMRKGQGVILQRYKTGSIADIKSFNIEEGLSWKMGSRNRLETNLEGWIGKRGASGRLVPNGFPRSNKFE